MSNITSADAVFVFLARHQSRLEQLKEMMLDSSFQINSINSSGLTPLKAGIMCGGAPEIHAMLEIGAIVNAEDILFAETQYPHKPDVVNVLRSWRARDAALAAAHDIKEL